VIQRIGISDRLNHLGDVALRLTAAPEPTKTQVGFSDKFRFWRFVLE
jgi:hypothetical protein